MKNIFYILSLCVALGCLKHGSDSESQRIIHESPKTTFVINVFPDTQEAVTRKTDMFTSQCDWIARVKDSLNIPVALQVGDLVNFDTISQYETASTIIKRLDDKNVPYVIAVGNHYTGVVLPNSGSAAPGNVNAAMINL